MKNNKILLVLCLIILIFSLNAISATTDNNTNVKVVQKFNEQSPVKEVTGNVYVNVNSKSQIEDGSKDNPYKTISKDNLEKLMSNTTMHVARGIYEISPVNITKDLIIIGEDRDGVVFTSKDESSIFTINTFNTLKISNLTFKDHNSRGSAVLTNYGNLNIYNLLFENNTGTMGAGISNNGNFQINGSIFRKNMASFGSAIYNRANLTVKNTSFIDNNISNVGGAIYGTNATMNISNSYFSGNRAVSGAAIYNAFGYLEVNNTLFKENEAEHFFGGAIYSTGITRTYNSIFDSNFANKDGGAITTTSNFTIVNCSFNENFAKENGGAIENVPWTDKENGNLTIINSSFTENAASLGGVIINYGKKEHVGMPATVTARDCLFDSNTADKGGVIYSEQYVDIQNSVLVDNTADEANVIYVSDMNYVTSLDNNWWGVNNPMVDDIGFMPDKWVVMKFTNKTGLYLNNTCTLNVSLNTLNDGTTIKTIMPVRIVNFIAENSTFKDDKLKIRDSVENTVKANDDNITAKIDNQILTLNTTKAPTPTIITINTIKQAKYKDIIHITGKFTDIRKKALINTTLKLKINNKTLNIKTDKNGTYKYNYKTTNTGQNNITVSYHGNSKYQANKTTLKFKVNKKNVKIKLNNIKTGYYKDKITVSGKFTDITGHPLQNTNIQLKINTKQIITKTDKEGTFKYKFTTTKTGINKITATYKGNNNYNKNTTTITFNITKKPTNIILNPIKTVKYKDNIKIMGHFMDKDNHALINTRINLNIGGKKVNVTTDKKGTFTYNYKTDKTATTRITAIFHGNNNYLKANSTSYLAVKKQDLKITTDKINKTKLGQKVKILGKLTDKNNHPLLNSIIKIKINNKTYTTKTGSHGIFTVNYKTVVTGINNITISRNANENYNKCAVKTQFTVSKLNK